MARMLRLSAVFPKERTDDHFASLFRVSVVASTGVSMYLAKDAIAATLHLTPFVSARLMLEINSCRD
jgi:hypothetical protein